MADARIITLDPSGAAGRMVRSALELLDLVPVQVDAPTVDAAMREIDRGATLFVVAEELDAQSGSEIAAQVADHNDDIAVVLITEDDVDTPHDSVVAISRGSAISFVRAVDAAIHHRSIRDAVRRTAAIPLLAEPDNSYIPHIDPVALDSVLDQLQIDLGALGLLLATRTGHLVVSKGAFGSLDVDRLVGMLAPTMKAGRDVRDVVGGQISTVQFYDGRSYAVFVLSIGLHHFLCVLYGGSNGARQFGAVNRFGRRGAEDIIARIGADAFIWQPTAQEPEPVRSTARMRAVRLERSDSTLEVPLAKAEFIETTPEYVPEPELTLEPIENLDLDALFGDDVALDGDAEHLFDLDVLEDLTKSTQAGKGKLDWDQAKEIGLIS